MRKALSDLCSYIFFTLHTVHLEIAHCLPDELVKKKQLGLPSPLFKVSCYSF